MLFFKKSIKVCVLGNSYTRTKACMHVRTYVRTYVCMYVCIFVDMRVDLCKSFESILSGL
jgi:hypothetical protein